MGKHIVKTKKTRTGSFRHLDVFNISLIVRASVNRIPGDLLTVLWILIVFSHETVTHSGLAFGLRYFPKVKKFQQ